MKEKFTFSFSIANPFHRKVDSAENKKRDRMRLIIAGSVLFALFLIYTYFVAREYLNQFDFDFTVRLQDDVPLRADPYLSWLSWLASFEVTTVMMGIVALLGALKSWKRLSIGIMFVLFHVVELAFKSHIDQVGPPYMFHRNTNEFHFPSSYVSLDYFSYPSGHSGRTAFLLFIAAYFVWKSTMRKLYKWSITGGIAILFVAMVLSRVSLGEHWVSDVIGGVLLGFSFAAFGLVFW